MDATFYVHADIDVLGGTIGNRDAICCLESALPRLVNQHTEVLAGLGCQVATVTYVEFHLVDRRTPGILSLLRVDLDHESQKRRGHHCGKNSHNCVLLSNVTNDGSLPWTCIRYLG